MLAIVLRFYKLGEWSFWIDEIFTIGHAQAHFSTIEKIIQNTPPARNWVPISVISTASVLNLTGISEWTARLAPAVIGIISIPLLYFPVKCLFGVSVSLVTSLLLAVSPWHLSWSQNARFYTALLLFYTLALFAFFYGLERDRLRYILLFMLMTYLAMSERLFAAFLGPVIVSYLILLKLLPFEIPAGFRLRNIILILSPGIVFGLIEMYSLVVHGQSRFFADFGWFFLYRTKDPLRMLSLISFSIGPSLIALAFFGGLYLLVQKSRIGLLMFLGAVIPITIVVLLNPFIFTKDRYVFVSLFSWLILAAVAVQAIFAQTQNYGKLIAVGVLVLLLTDAAGTNLLYYQVNNGNRRDWKGAFTLVKERSQAGDELVTWWPDWEGFYVDQEIILWENIDPEFVTHSGKRFWFVLDDETIWGNGRMKRWMEQNAELIGIKYLRQVNDIYLVIYLYDPARNAHTNNSSEEGMNILLDHNPKNRVDDDDLSDQ